MIENLITSFKKALNNPFNMAMACAVIFLIWQVTNHIPTQIDRLEDKMDKRMDRLEDKMDTQYREIMKILIDIKGKPNK
ncbi:MAG: hypothetical protein MPJ25_15220 [Pirellulales bacterium]|nr:hypothetical protein [Pirellulales bacterium]